MKFRYKIQFLLETKKNIIKIIKDYLIQFYSYLQNKEQSNEIIDFVLKVFIPYNWYLNKSTINLDKSMIISSNNQSGQNDNNIIDNSNSFIPLDNPSYNKQRDEDSGRNFDYYEDVNEYDLLIKKCQDEMAFKILQNSKFSLNVKKENKDLISYNKIKTYDKEIDIDQVKSISSKNKVLNDNYKKFISFLNEIEKKIKNDCPHTLEFDITLKFFTETVNIFSITCEYILVISGKEPKNYKDNDILESGISGGFEYLINEIKNNNED